MTEMMAALEWTKGVMWLEVQAAPGPLLETRAKTTVGPQMSRKETLSEFEVGATERWRRIRAKTKEMALSRTFRKIPKERGTTLGLLPRGPREMDTEQVKTVLFLEFARRAMAEETERGTRPLELLMGEEEMVLEEQLIDTLWLRRSSR